MDGLEEGRVRTCGQTLFIGSHMGTSVSGGSMSSLTFLFKVITDRRLVSVFLLCSSVVGGNKLGSTAEAS